MTHTAYVDLDDFAPVGSSAFRGGPLSLSNKIPRYGGSMDYVRAFDGSNYTTGTGPGGDLTADDCRRMADAGIHLGIIQALIPPPGYPRSGDSQLSARMGRAVLDADMALDAYLYWIQGGVPFPTKIALMEGLEVRRWKVDLEERPDIPAWSLNASITYALQSADQAPCSSGDPAEIYTAWWWVEWYLARGGDIALLQNRPIWWVWDDGKADPTLDRIPAGKRPSGRRPSAYGLDDSLVRSIQYSLSTSVAGVSGIDLSVLTSLEGDSLMSVPKVPDDYTQKFALSGPYDWPGVVSNLEGIIHDLQASARPPDTADDAKEILDNIRQVLTLHGYTVTSPSA